MWWDLLYFCEVNKKKTMSLLLRDTGPVRVSGGPASPRWIRVTPGCSSDTGPRSRSRRICWNPGILLLLLPSGIKVRPPPKLLDVYSFNLNQGLCQKIMRVNLFLVNLAHLPQSGLKFVLVLGSIEGLLSWHSRAVNLASHLASGTTTRKAWSLSVVKKK